MQVIIFPIKSFLLSSHYDKRNHNNYYRDRGDRLRLVNTTLTMPVGSRVETVRTEASVFYLYFSLVQVLTNNLLFPGDIKMWNVTHHRLVASGVHVKMPYSRPPKAAL